MSEVAAISEAKNSRTFKESDAANIRDWMQEIAGDSEVKVAIRRTHPKTFKGNNTAGHLETTDGFITEREISERWGGGKYALRIMTPNTNGTGFKYTTGCTIEVAGNPKIDEGDEFGSERSVERPNVQTEVVKSAMMMNERQLRAAEERAEKASSQSGFDYNAMQTLLAPMQEQVRSAQEEARELRQQMLMMANKKPEESPFRDLAFKMHDEQNSGINNLREMHLSEIRTLKESHTAELRMMRESGRDDLKDRQRMHDREIENMRESFKAQNDAAKVALESRIDSLKSEISRLERDLGESKTEVGALKAQKQKTLPETLAEASQLKEALEAFSGGGGEGEGEKWYEKFAGAAFSSPAVMKLIGAVAPEEEGSEVAAQPQLQAQNPTQVQTRPQIPNLEDSDGHPLPQVNIPFEGPNGEILVRTKNDRVIQITEEQAKEIAAAQGIEIPSEDTSGPKPPSPEQVKIAVTFMENAIRNGTEPEQFAATARNLVPGEILQYIEAVGVDQFLEKTARLETGSMLRTEHGRIFLKKVSQILLTGSSE